MRSVLGQVVVVSTGRAACVTLIQHAVARWLLLTISATALSGRCGAAAGGCSLTPFRTGQGAETFACSSTYLVSCFHTARHTHINIVDHCLVASAPMSRKGGECLGQQLLHIKICCSANGCNLGHCLSNTIHSLLLSTSCFAVVYASMSLLLNRLLLTSLQESRAWQEVGNSASHTYREPHQLLEQTC